MLRVGARAAGAAIALGTSVIGAAGGLMGGGKSGMVKSKAGKEYAADSNQGKVIVQAKKDREAKAKAKAKASKGGMSLAKVKPSIGSGAKTIRGGAGVIGGMPEVATGHESEATILSQILSQIGTNTGILNAMLNVLATPPPPPSPEPIPTPPQDLIDNSQKVRGDEGDGKIKRVFGTVTKKLKDISGSLAGTGKFLLKGLLGGAALLGFMKYKDKIRDFIARGFEGLESFGSKFFNSDDPLGTFLDALTSTGEGSILDSLKKGLAFVIEELVLALTLMLNKFLPGFAKLDLTQEQYESQVAEIAPDKQEAVNNSVVKAAGFGAAIIDSKDSGIDDDTAIALNNVVAKRIERMFEAYAMSGGRVQWTNVGSGFNMQGPQSLTNMNPGITVNDIMTSVPLFDGREITNASLDAGLDYGKGMEGLDDKTLKEVTQLLQYKNNFVQQQRMGITKTRGFFGLGATPLSEKVLSIDKKIQDLKTPSGDTASLGNNGNINLVESGAKIGTVNTGDNVAMASRVDHTDPTQQALQQLIA